jgi:exonuclease III
MDNFPCRGRETCRHARTFYSKRRPHVAYQDDYLFASPALAERLVTCKALPVNATSPSDHAPIVGF